MPLSLALLWMATVAGAAEKGSLRNWTAVTGHQMRAALVDADETQVQLEREDGRTLFVPLEKLSAADQQYVRRWLAGNSANHRDASPDEDGAAVETRGRVPSRSAAPPVAASEVVAEGIGVDPEKAEQNAFSRAIEQVVGVLVDSETLVQNDELIREQILTSSRGYVETFEVVKRWEEDGLHHARIRATVARSKLVEKLTAHHIAVRTVEGERMALQAEHDFTNESQAADIFEKEMAKFRMDQLLTVEVRGDPEVLEQDDTHAKLRLAVTVRPNLEEWKAFEASLRPVLQRVAAKRSAMTCQPNRAGQYQLVSPDPAGLGSRLAGDGILVSLFVKASADFGRTQWEVFRVPEPFSAIVNAANSRKYQLVYALMDHDGNVVLEEKEELAMREGMFYSRLHLISYCAVDSVRVGRAFGAFTGAMYWIGPTLYSGDVRSKRLPSADLSVDVHLPKEDLRKVVKLAAFLREATPRASRQESNQNRFPTPARPPGGIR